MPTANPNYVAVTDSSHPIATYSTSESASNSSDSCLDSMLTTSCEPAVHMNSIPLRPQAPLNDSSASSSICTLGETNPNTMFLPLDPLLQLFQQVTGGVASSDGITNTFNSQSSFCTPTPFAFDSSLTTIIPQFASMPVQSTCIPAFNFESNDGQIALPSIDVFSRAFVRSEERDQASCSPTPSQISRSKEISVRSEEHEQASCSPTPSRICRAKEILLGFKKPVPIPSDLKGSSNTCAFNSGSTASSSSSLTDTSLSTPVNVRPITFGTVLYQNKCFEVEVDDVFVEKAPSSSLKRSSKGKNHCAVLINLVLYSVSS